MILNKKKHSQRDRIAKETAIAHKKLPAGAAFYNKKSISSIKIYRTTI